jgi:hypothetical protein
MCRGLPEGPYLSSLTTLILSHSKIRGLPKTLLSATQLQVTRLASRVDQTLLFKAWRGILGLSQSLDAPIGWCMQPDHTFPIKKPKQAPSCTG